MHPQVHQHFSKCVHIFVYYLCQLKPPRQDAPFDGRQCTIANPHGNAVVDLDGDCLAGLSKSFTMAAS